GGSNWTGSWSSTPKAVGFPCATVGSLSALVYNDANGSHNPAGQTGIPGAGISITGPNGYTATATTGADGTIPTINNLPPGNYTVCAVSGLTGYTQTTPAPLSGCTTVQVTAGGTAQAQLGYVQTGALNADVFNSSNSSGISGVGVTITGPN